MNYNIYTSPKGYMIIAQDKSEKLFIFDDTHTLRDRLPDIINNGEFIRGVPFGDNKDIIPIYIRRQEIPVIKHKSLNYKLLVIWRYYRKLVLHTNKPRDIKRFALTLKDRLRIAGVDKTYNFVLNADVRESNELIPLDNKHFLFR